MKKLLLILALFTCLGASSQRLSWSFDLATMVTDTTIYFKYAGDRTYSFDFVYTSLVGTSGTLTIVGGNTDSTLISVDSAVFPVTILQADTSDLIIDDPYGTVYIGFTITKGTLTAGDVDVIFNYN